MHSRVMCLVVVSVYVRTYVRTYVHTYMYIYFLYMSTKNRLFSALLLEKLLLHVSVICCLLFEFKCLQCGLLHPTSYTARAIHAFPNKTRRPPWPWNIFFWALTARHTHGLWRTMHCIYANWRVQCRSWTPATSLGTRCTCSTLNWSACSVRTGYVFFRTLVFCLLSLSML